MNRQVFVGNNNAALPGQRAVLLDLGHAARGQEAIKLRFRDRHRPRRGPAGLYIDNIVSSGITNAPLHGDHHRRRRPAASTPDANAGPDQDLC
jgi:hypothetical protein